MNRPAASLASALLLAALFTVLAAVLAVFLIRRHPAPAPRAPAIIPPAEHRRIASNVLYTVSQETAAEVLRIEAREKKIAETLWSTEQLARHCARTIEALWDKLKDAAPAARWDVLASFPFAEIRLPNWQTFNDLPHSIQSARHSGEGRRLKAGKWRTLVDQFQRNGWLLEQIEFRHNRFDPGASDKPPQSRFYFSAHLQLPSRAPPDTNSLRVQIEGDLDITWAEPLQRTNAQAIARLDATALTLKRRAGPPSFKLVLDQEIIPKGQPTKIDPLILYDLDGDGLSEIILAGRNLVYRNRSFPVEPRNEASREIVPPGGDRGSLRFEAQALCRFPEEFISAALIADFNNDGLADFLCKKWEGLFLFNGTLAGLPHAQFDQKPLLIWKPDEPLINPKVITCGDIDADGDLDLFIAQYKEPYEGGATPKPFHDANDGYPAYLLLNQGGGRFVDETEPRGLGAKRSRRTFSASFSDLDRDRDLDLVIVSDFAGLDLYRNDGAGRFTDVTQSWVRDWHAFGMSHRLTDFNNDARIDLLMMGMTSPTVERLNHLGLARSTAPGDRELELKMTFGNRLYLGKDSTGFDQPELLNKPIARAGWAWSCTTFDFGNDGFEDIYVANGLESNQSVIDYEPEYWLHDRFVGVEKPTLATDLYFKAKTTRTRGGIHSYAGYEKNRLFLNLGGTNFLEAGYLFGAAIENDCRNVVADDLDADGRVDLILMTFELWPRPKQTLKILHNTGGESGNWIALRFDHSAVPWPGAEIKLTSADTQTIRHLPTGDAFRSQHAPAAHFGLGTKTNVAKIEIQAVASPVRILANPANNRVLTVH